MDKHHAEAIAKAVLHPELKAQEEARRRKEKAAWLLVEKRKAAWLGLAGFAIGAGAAHISGVSFTVGGLWGGLAGAAIGWAIVGWRGRQHTG